MPRIARLHAEHSAQRALADALKGRLVALRGATSEDVARLEAGLIECGARVKRVILPETQALVIGSRPSPDDVATARRRGLAVLEGGHVEKIRSARIQLREREQAQFRVAAERALGQARWLQFERRVRIAETAQAPARAAKPASTRMRSAGLRAAT